MPPRAGRLALAVTAALGAGAAHALDWSQQPTVSVGQATDSNFHMTVNDPREVASSRLEVGTVATGASERVRFTVRPRAYSITYHEDRIEDRNDGHLDTGLVVGNDRRTWTLGAGYTRDGTLANSFEESGFTLVDLDRDIARYSAGYSAVVSERNSLSLSASGQQIDYEQRADIPTRFTDYDYAGLAFEFAHAMTERVTFELGVSGYELETQPTTLPATGPTTGQPSEPTRNAGLSFGFAGNLSESLDYRVGLGRYGVRGPGIDGELIDRSVDLLLAKRWEFWRVTFTAQAGLEPSAYGVLYRREIVSIDINHRFTERFDASLRLTGADIESEQPGLYVEQRRYAYAQLYLNWRFAERLWLSFSAGERAQRYFERPRAQGTYGQIGITYRGRGS